jgi:hypothetical protein
MNKYFFIVQTGYEDRVREICDLSDEENMRISSEATDDLYESGTLDLVGLFEKGEGFSFRSDEMSNNYSHFDPSVFNLDGDYLVLASTFGSLEYVNKYVFEMKFCRVVVGEIIVKGFQKHEDCDYVFLEFGSEGG